MNMKDANNQKIILYKAEDGSFTVDVKLEEGTVWLSQRQMTELFNKDKRTISEHVQNVFEEGELKKDSTVRNFRTVQKEGNREIERDIEYYNLDVIISVGYRVKSQEGTQFRIWATQRLKDHLIKGYTFNDKRLQEKGFEEFEEAVALIKKTLETKELTTNEATGLLKVITDYANSWFLLQKYDEEALVEPKEKVISEYVLDYSEVQIAVSELKQSLITKKETSELFGQERDSLEGVLGNVYQTFDGVDLYASIEEKSAYILYFIIKDHPFVDGNKRIGSFLFILFLAKHNYLEDSYGERKFNDNALVALALLIAESEPRQKELIIKLVMNFVKGE